MTIRHLPPLLVAWALVLSSGIANAQTAPAPAPTGGGLTILEFKPAMDDMMTMLVQPRHIKLFAAGQAGNWGLAGFQLNELRGALKRIGQTIPVYRKQNIDGAVASIVAPAIAKMDTAIKSSDPAQFASAYGELTAACNACHVALEHPFLVIKAPDAAAMSPFIDQDFRPTAK